MSTAQAELTAGALPVQEEAFRDIFLEHYPLVYSLAFRVIGRPDAAEDVAQEVFVKLFSLWPRLHIRISLKAWLARTALNLSYNGARFERRQTALLERAWWVEGSEHGASAEESVEREADRRLVAEVLGKLKHRDRCVLLLRHSGLRTFAANVLQLFRLEQFEIVQIDPRVAGNFDPQQFGALAVDEPNPVRLGSLEEAGKLLDGDAVEPQKLPDNFRRLGLEGMTHGGVTITFDVERLNRLARGLGSGDLAFPQELDGKRLTGIIPASVMISYGSGGQATSNHIDPPSHPDAGAPSPNAGEAPPSSGGFEVPLQFIQAGLPSYEIDADVDLDKLWARLLKHPLLPPSIAEQLSKFTDWKHTLPIPIPADMANAEKVRVAGKHQAVYIRETRGLNAQVLLWNTGERLFGLVDPEGKLSRADLFAIAGSVPEPAR